MKNLILIVEDNEQLLFNLKIILQFNNYGVVTATNGKKGLKALSELEQTPNLIICDIMMPEMDGYEFFEKVSQTPKWSRIPFVFLTAKVGPEDIRFGKMLGVDDYITKPYKKEDLLAIVAGKIARKTEIERISNKLVVNLSSIREEIRSWSEDKEQNTHLIIAVWDKIKGSVINTLFPSETESFFPIKDLIGQLFFSKVALFGHRTTQGQGQGILLPIKNFNRDGYAFFDVIEAKKGELSDFMIAVLAPKISYFESLKIKELFKEIASRIKNNESLNLENYWNQILRILSMSPV